ncbi:RES family NAD+ phosphorylase [Sphingomonas sp. MMS24-J13]|uniref:RES family NAD+ phosphorylase n=1 Tax=Sphingomonas sp. MMS24-J13 TaxID=3238686 RepID=UPI00384B618E
MTLPMLPYDGPVWRLLPRAFIDTPAIAARASEGRFHHSGQIAAYASLSAEGASVAIQRYLSDGVERVLIPMWLTAGRVADAREIPSASVVWQDLRKAGQVSPTWMFSDAARQAGAQAMLYSSRSRPDLSHVVVFEPKCLSQVS